MVINGSFYIGIALFKAYINISFLYTIWTLYKKLTINFLYLLYLTKTFSLLNGLFEEIFFIF